MAPENSGSGRPSTFSRDDAVARAMELFWQNGYLSVTARDLAAAMKIQRSSFYNSFRTKEAVFREALSRYAELAPDAALERLQPGDPVVPAVVSTLRELCRLRSADKAARGCLVCNSVAELVGVDKNLGKLLDEALQKRVRQVRSLFERAEKQGELEFRTSAADAANAFVSFLLGINLLSKTIRDEKTLWRACRTFLAGLGFADADLR